jgi:uncharacterized membrane protein
MILAVISIIALIAAGVHHYNMFHSEYTLSTWQYGLAAYAPWIVLGIAFLFILAALGFLFGDADTKSKVMNIVSTPMEAIQNAVANSANVMPSANTATNPITAAINTGLNAITNITGGNTKPANTTTSTNNAAAKQPSPLLPGLNFSASQI